MALGWALALAAPVAAQGRLQVPQPVGYVNDFANVIEPAYRDSIQRVIDEVRARSGGEIVVVTLPSLQGRPPEEVARQIGRDWKVGQKGDPTDQRRNTGAVVLISTRDRKWRIETGTGAMTFVTAGEAGRIGRDYMLPQLQRGNEGRGLLMAVAGLAQEYAREYRFQLTGDVPAPAAPAAEPQRGRRGRSGGGSFWIFVIIVVVMVISSRGGGGGRGRRGRRGWGGPVIIPFPMGGGGGWGGGGFGGGGGGGFGGFGGGGGFSGGGAGGDW